MIVKNVPHAPCQTIMFVCDVAGRVFDRHARWITIEPVYFTLSSDVRLTLVLASILDPLSSSSFTMLLFPLFDATWSGVMSFWPIQKTEIGVLNELLMNIIAGSQHKHVIIKMAVGKQQSCLTLWTKHVISVKQYEPTRLHTAAYLIMDSLLGLCVLVNKYWS